MLGWARTLSRPRRRLAGLIPLLTIALLTIWPYTEAGRFLIPLIPCLLIGAVEGLGQRRASLVDQAAAPGYDRPVSGCTRPF